MIERSNPDIGYLAEEVHTTFSFTQTIKAGSTVYFSGVTPLRGSPADLQVVGENDMRAQLEWCLEILRRCLAEQGATFHHFVSQTVYTTDMDELVKHADVFAKAHQPRPGCRSSGCSTLRSCWRSPGSPCSTSLAA